ncbi:cytochrome b5-like heme/steroid binding domain-containing protein, partial [Leucosporidium creatinivorum]
KRVKVHIEKGYSQLDWARKQRSGEDLRVSSLSLRGGVTELSRITYAELASHNTRDDCWHAYSGKVYNVTPFLKYHPGGVGEMMRAAGKDGTELFMKTHAWVNVDLMLDGCLVGFLVRE